MGRWAIVFLTFRASHDHIALHVRDWHLTVLTHHLVIILIVVDRGRSSHLGKFSNIDKALFGPLVLTQVDTSYFLVKCLFCMVGIGCNFFLLCNRNVIDISDSFIFTHFLSHFLIHHVLCSVC